MTGLLLRKFVRNYENTGDPAVRDAVGRLSGIVGILCNVLLFAAKFLAGRDADKTPEDAPQPPKQTDPNAVRELYVEFQG